MSNIRDRKAELFGRISSCRTFSDAYPQLFEINSWKSVNSSGDQLEFMVDLFSALGSIDQLQNAISKILLEKLDVMEQEVKEALKASLKSNICCNINPSLFKEDIDFSVSEFDLLNMFQINPKSEVGSSSYFDNYSGEESEDMNVFLYEVITKSGVNRPWFQYNQFNDYTEHLKSRRGGIGWFTFNENKTVDGIINENVLSLSVLPPIGITSPSEPYKTLNDWTSDYIDSIKFFDKETFVKQLMAKIFGGFGGRGLSSEQIVLQQLLEEILNRMSQCQTGSSESDDSFFSFDNTMYSLMLEKAEKQKVGDYEYDRLTGTAVRITLEDITKAFEGLDQKHSFEEQKQVFCDGIDILIDQATTGNPNINESEKQQFKKNLLKSLLNELSLAFGMTLITPKIYIVILANMRLMGIKTNYDATTFIRDNVNLVSYIVGAIKDSILKQMLREIKSMAKRLMGLVVKEMIKDNKKKFTKTLRGLLPGGRRRKLL